MASKYSALYRKFREKKVEEWSKIPPEKIGACLDTSEMGGDALKPVDFGCTFLIAAKVAHAASEAEFVDFIENGEAPPIKLSQKEMEALRGGSRLAMVGSPETMEQLASSLTQSGVNFKVKQTKKGLVRIVAHGEAANLSGLQEQVTGSVIRSKLHVGKRDPSRQG